MLERYIKKPVRDSVSLALQLIGQRLIEIGSQLQMHEGFSVERNNLIRLLLEPKTGQSHEELEIMRAYVSWLQSEIDSFSLYNMHTLEYANLFVLNTVELSNIMKSKPDLPIKEDLQDIFQDIVKNCTTHLISWNDISEGERQVISRRALEIQQEQLRVLNLLPFQSFNS